MIRPTLVALFLAPALAGLPVRAATVYVASQQGAQVTRLEAGTVAGHATVAGAPATVATGGGSVFLSHPDGHTITVADAATGAVLRRLPYKGQGFGLAASADGRTLFVADWSGNRIDRLSAADGTVEASAETGRDPAHIALDRAGRLYVADRESHQVSVFDGARMTRLATIPVGTAPFALALSPDERRLYVGNVRSNDLTVIDTEGLKALATVPAGAMPYGVSVSPDGARVFVTNQHAGTVTVLDAGTLATTATIGVGRYPEGIVIEGGKAYVANWFSDTVSVIDLATLREVTQVPVAEGPRSLAIAAPAKDALR
ncbi:UNVERIFIED_ORG: YVTN family beta-propeller protein [Methylobacterium sp. SuP10 SLI 274]|uniref:YncE family protein n=1 Tax=Methylorubrum extorquens TaxID=408 RepID=UPI00209EDCF8|nr:YncE family protein [Methylorubrum extorquens]MDF9863471.1 YVTN family beta-propeller protein [Methylorubrum pseudosasae]MDH6637077.1 YVTN family beta-propeller protein [Methylobacterium sp. SuP10 SLI 274]MDH6666253.1 YVTN family beta-propeller protein [Methylorubrum zatmanii]MCP1558168.1 YVTN family beta-propeller protein [Methylorubrum extorquens]MDF9791779.1 YVTN family beta-propeller protein [Methylorubrum extorquens]